MRIDRNGLQRADRALRDALAAHVKRQHAFYAEDPDGRVSAEVEGLDTRKITRAVLTRYLGFLSSGK